MAGVVGVHTTLIVSAVGGCLSVLWLLPSPLPHLRSLPDPE